MPNSTAFKSLNMVTEALNASAIVAITDRHGVIKQVNQKFCQISGYREDELIGQNHRILKSGFHPPEFYQELWNDICSGRVWEGQIKNRAKDGHFYWVHTVIVPFRDDKGQAIEFVSIRWDITRQKEDEQNLKNLMDTAFEGLVIYDLSGRIQWCNQRAEDILRPITGHTSLVGEYVNSVFQEKLIPFSNFHGEIPITGKEESRILEVNVRPFHSEHRGYLIVFRDITEKEKLEAQIIQQDRLASAGILASGLAHEIGTPLGVMRARAELETMLPQADERVKQTYQIIIEQIDRITGLMNSLLNLTRNQESVNLGAVNPRKVVDDNFQLLTYELRKNEIQFINELSPDDKVLAVHSSLFQVFLNLFVNAVHAIQNQKSKNPNFNGQIRVRSFEKEGEIYIYIEDNGPGVSPEHRDHLFRPFFTTKDVGKGTGLGLATSRKIIQAWGGDLQLDPTYSGGARFVIRLRKQ